MKKFLINIVGACVFAMISGTVMAATLEALWKLDNDSTAANNSEYDGVASSGVTFDAGQVNRAAHFDGGTEYGENNDSIDYIDSLKVIPASDFNGGLSIMGWLKPSDQASGKYLVRNGGNCCGTGAYGFSAAFISPGYTQLFLRNTSDGRMYGDSPENSVPVDVWSHVALTWNGSTTGGIKIYVNGLEVPTTIRFIGTAFTGLNGTTPIGVRIGATRANSVGTMRGYIGDIDNLSLWKGALTAQEILSDFEATSSPQEPIDAIENLITLVIALNLKKGISNSLDAKLGAALNALDDMNTNNDIAAINSLYAFISSVQAQSGGWIMEEDATALENAAAEIIGLLSPSP